jgi:hypothetical protein
MDCIEFRRLILADPRTRTPEQEAHLAGCSECANLARGMENFESRLYQAMNVAVPDALAERILLLRRIRPSAARVWALAASLVLAVAISAYFYPGLGPEREQVIAAASVGESHPAVAAISYVVDHESKLLAEGRSGDPAIMRAALARLGLKLPSRGVNVRYLGKCPVPTGTGEHVVLETALGRVTLILVPDHPMGPRVIVADRQMTALTVPVGTGGYILVADSIDHLRRIEKTLM